MMKKLVSVIVPVYNVEDYVARCLESICRQSYDNIEIIVVNDGSSDGSAEICNRYALRDKRIRYLEQENYGVSSARNRGLELSTGSFIMFVDADDSLEENAVEQCIKNVNDNDMLVFGYKEINENDLVLRTPNEYDSVVVDKDTMIEYLLYRPLNYQYQGYLWNKLYRAEIINNYCIRFHESIKYNEDRLFIFDYLKYCRKVKLVSAILYLYRIYDNSAMGQSRRFFKPDILTELKAFEIMQSSLNAEYDNRLYMLISLSVFYSARVRLPRIPNEYKKERDYVTKMLNQSFKICLLSHCSAISIRRKAKMIVQYSLIKCGLNTVRGSI